MPDSCIRGKGRLRSRRAMERRFSSLRSYLTHREETGYYADFGKLSNLADTLKNGWCYSGQYSIFPAAAPRKFPRGNCALSVRRLHPKSRSSRESRARRATQLTGRSGGAETGGGHHVLVAIHTAPIHGRGVWRNFAVPILCQPRRPGFGRGGSQRPPGRVFLVRLGPRGA